MVLDRDINSVGHVGPTVDMDKGMGWCQTGKQKVYPRGGDVKMGLMREVAGI